MNMGKWSANLRRDTTMNGKQMRGLSKNICNEQCFMSIILPVVITEWKAENIGIEIPISIFLFFSVFE